MGSGRPESFPLFIDIFQRILKYPLMETKQATGIFEALSSDVRLDLFGSSSFGVDLLYIGIKSTANDRRSYERE